MHKNYCKFARNEKNRLLASSKYSGFEDDKQKYKLIKTLTCFMSYVVCLFSMSGFSPALCGIDAPL